MLGFAKHSPLEKKPVPVLDSDDEFVSEYNRVAKKLNVTAIAATSLARVLVAEAVPVIDRAAMERYMDKKGNWGWFRYAGKAVNFQIPRLTPTSFRSLFGPTHEAAYEAPVPLPVLLTIEKISDALPGEVGFYVAAPETNPDPFLAAIHVTTREIFVVERWDEPSFRG